MDKIKYLIEKHFESKHFEVEASIDYYTKTGHVNGILYQKMREMLVEACGGGTSEREQANEILPLVSGSVCPKCGCNKIIGDGTKSWCLNERCDFVEAD